MSTRLIGIRHQQKLTKEGKMKPTQLVFFQDGEVIETLNLESNQEEIDFAAGFLPTKFRYARKDEDISNLAERHVDWRKIRSNENEDNFADYLTEERKNGIYVAQIPAGFRGLEEGDLVVTMLGGSGGDFNHALSTQADRVGARVVRVPSFYVGKHFPDDRENDAFNVMLLWQEHPELFYEFAPRDREMINVRAAQKARVEAMKERIACGNRLLTRNKHETYRDIDGSYPELALADNYEVLKASDPAYQALVAEEKERVKELEVAVEATDVWQEVFEPITGMGIKLAAPIIARIYDVRRFATAAKLKKYCRVHVCEDGSFPRRRRGQSDEGINEIRTALYNLDDQFNRRPDSYWGQKRREYKANLRTKHPEVVVDENGKKKYTDGHIHKMARWRTLTRFVEWLFNAWWELEGGQRQECEAA